jgi:hypothetical protein
MYQPKPNFTPIPIKTIHRLPTKVARANLKPRYLRLAKAHAQTHYKIREKVLYPLLENKSNNIGYCQQVEHPVGDWASLRYGPR